MAIALPRCINYSNLSYISYPDWCNRIYWCCNRRYAGHYSPAAVAICIKRFTSRTNYNFHFVGSSYERYWTGCGDLIIIWPVTVAFNKEYFSFIYITHFIGVAACMERSVTINPVQHYSVFCMLICEDADGKLDAGSCFYNCNSYGFYSPYAVCVVVAMDCKKVFPFFVQLCMATGICQFISPQ